MRRLASFAILGHMPAITGWCSTTPEGKERCEEAIAKQRVVASRKQWEQISAAKEEAARTNNMAAIKLK